MDQPIEQFFRRFERANVRSDLAAIGGLYADTFMFGGVNGVRVVKKEDFIKVVPRMKAHYASMGLSGTELVSLEASDLDIRYILAKVRWRMTLSDLNGDRTGIDAFATYLLERQEDNTLSIIVQIDHRDLAKLIKNPHSALHSVVAGRQS